MRGYTGVRTGIHDILNLMLLPNLLGFALSVAARVVIVAHSSDRLKPAGGAKWAHREKWV